MSKDWVGNGNSVFKALAASNHSFTERQPEDYYATEPRAAELLLENERFDGPIWECACGEKHLSNVFTNWGGTTFAAPTYTTDAGTKYSTSFPSKTRIGMATSSPTLPTSSLLTLCTKRSRLFPMERKSACS